MGSKYVAAFLAVLWGASLPAQEMMGARTFVAQLYIKKTNDRHFNFSSPRILTPDLYDLVRKRGTDALGYDPLCQCQDNDGLSAQILSLTGDAQQMVARVLLRFDADRIAPPKRVTLVLRRSLAGWKIADIQSASVPSLKRWLERNARGRAR